MPMWPFGRRGGKAAKLKGRSAAVSEANVPVAARAHEFASSDALRDSPTRRRSRRRRRSSRSSASLRDVEKSSPNRLADQAFLKEKEQGLRRHSSDDDITALPNQKRLEQSPHLRPISQQHIYAYNFPQATSQSSLPTARDRGRLQRPQSLRRSANESALVRRKSSKKQKREPDHIREEEIRAMSMPMPQKRSAASSGGMLRRDSKKVKGPLNRRFERPNSDVSLPLEESIHSSMSGSSDPRAFRVSALDMFSPRPTIRCSVGTQYYYNNIDSSPTSNKSKRDTTGRRTMASRPDTDDRRTSRIDDLADTLDAGALREILDRDKRRRDKKRRQEDERLRRRLERRAEKQRASEAGGTPATPRQESHGVIGLGIEKDAPVPMEDVRPSTPQTPTPQRPQQPQRLETASLAPKTHENSQLPTPVESPMEEAVVSNAQAIRYSRGSVSGPLHSRGPSNISQMPELLSEKFAQETPIESVEQVHDPTASGSLHAVETVDTVAGSRKSTGRRRSSEGRRLGVFASLFRRNKRSSQDPGRTTPSEVSFSNTSRESMSRQPLPAHLAPAQPTQPITIKRPSSVPRRTMSKFREDLPEFPLSPPDSRVQSPEASRGSAIAARRRSQQPTDLNVESNSSGTGARTDSPVSPGVPNAGLMSQSLASVDSEGSWLSGKPVNRRSNRSYFRSSVGSSSALKRTEDFNASYEELGVPDDEYFKRLTPQPDEHHSSPPPNELVPKASSAAMADQDPAADSGDEEAPHTSGRASVEEEQVHTIARHPTVVHRQPRVKSTEGLLSFFQAEKIAAAEESADTVEGAEIAEAAEGESPTSDHEFGTVQRAKSVDFGKNHVRHLSAGSAKLLDIQKRASVSAQTKPQLQR
jgi:hypothetical protein